MRWEDERYVRIYTRDTVDWLGLSFIAQGLFCLILRKVDRAGLIKLGKPGKRGVAIVLGFAGEWPRLEPALEELLVDGCVRIQGDHLVVPNFIEAQDATQSDAQRKRESRARARDMAAAQVVLGTDKTSGGVTDGHDSGQIVRESHAAVTCRHDPSRAVTPNCAVPCLTTETSPPPAPARVCAPGPRAEATTTPTPEAPPVAALLRRAAVPVDDPPPRPLVVESYPDQVNGIYRTREAAEAATAAELYPLTAELQQRLAPAWEVGLARTRPQRAAVERAIGTVTVEVAAARLRAMVAEERAAGREPQPTLGWHLRVITGEVGPATTSAVGDLGVEAFRWWHRLTEAEAQEYLAERQAIDPELGPDAPFGAPGTTHVAEVEALNERWRLRAAGGAA